MDLAFITPHKVGYVEIKRDGLKTTTRGDNRTQAVIFSIGVIGLIQAGIVSERYCVDDRVPGIRAFFIFRVERFLRELRINYLTED